MRVSRIVFYVRAVIYAEQSFEADVLFRRVIKCILYFPVAFLCRRNMLTDTGIKQLIVIPTAEHVLRYVSWA